MIQIGLWLGSFWGRAGVIAALFSLLALWRVSDVQTQRAVGATKVVIAAKKAGAKANATNTKVRAAAAAPGAAERLRKSGSCRDC